VVALGGVVAYPAVEATTVPEAAWALAVLAPLCLVAGLVLRVEAVALGLFLAGADYLAYLALDHPGLDAWAPVVVIGIALAAELAFWSVALAGPVPPAPGEWGRRALDAAAVALGAGAATLVALAAGQAGTGGGFALELLAAVASVAALAVLAKLATQRRAVDSG
jgi:hypothetical protein